jgi:hypothetical protein
MRRRKGAMTMTEPTSAEMIQLDMLGGDLRDAILSARTRLSDSSVMARIGEVEGGGAPPGFVPGLVSVHREGHPTVYGLGHDEAVAHLLALV